MSPTYSICMVNYNMARTLGRAVDSVASQLNNDFEIVLVDDGSFDDSVRVMRELAARYPMIRVVTLDRDRNRKLGETCNVSIREARGQYCLLHVDCDDVWGPHLVAWVEVFHQIESAIGVDILLAGRQVHMAKRGLLLSHGPYQNIFRGQDRHMYLRFGALGRLWYLDHEVFRTRLPHLTSEKYRRTVIHTIDHMTTDFRSGIRLGDSIRSEMITAKEKNLNLILFRLAMLPVAWCLAKFKPPIRYEISLAGPQGVTDHRKRHTGTFAELMCRHGGIPDWSRLPSSSRRIFDR